MKCECITAHTLKKFCKRYYAELLTLDNVEETSDEDVGTFDVVKYYGLPKKVGDGRNGVFRLFSAFSVNRMIHKLSKLDCVCKVLSLFGSIRDQLDLLIVPEFL